MGRMSVIVAQIELSTSPRYSLGLPVVTRMLVAAP